MYRSCWLADLITLQTKQSTSLAILTCSQMYRSTRASSLPCSRCQARCFSVQHAGVAHSRFLLQRSARELLLHKRGKRFQKRSLNCQKTWIIWKTHQRRDSTGNLTSSWKPCLTHAQQQKGHSGNRSKPIEIKCVPSNQDKTGRGQG